MTEKLQGLYVCFEKDIREDDAEALIEAIKCLRGVLAVAPLMPDPDSWIARERVENELRQKLMTILWPKIEED
jgi:hypothetical protein